MTKSKTEKQKSIIYVNIVEVIGLIKSGQA